MGRAQVIEQLTDIEDGIKRLLSERDSLIQENEILKSSIQILTDQRNELALAIEEFMNREKIGKIVTSITEKTLESEEMRQQLSEYIRILDRCIKFVSES